MAGVSPRASAGNPRLAAQGPDSPSLHSHSWQLTSQSLQNLEVFKDQVSQPLPNPSCRMLSVIPMLDVPGMEALDVLLTQTSKGGFQMHPPHATALSQCSLSPAMAICGHVPVPT